MAEALGQAVWRYAHAHADADGIAATPIAGMGMMRACAPSGLTRALAKPVLCLVLQGARQVTVGGEVRECAAGQTLVVGVDLPIVGRVVRASPQEPYLALSLELEMGVMREVMGRTWREVAARTGPPRRPGPARFVPALFVDDTDEAVADCAGHLVRLLDRPEAIPALRPAIVEEMHCRLLAGRHGAAIRRLALPEGHAARVARAVALLRAEFSCSLPVERLAAAAGMSRSSFHQHFKAVTSLSPRQFHKQLRLLEARRLMLKEGLGAGRAAVAVGYESVAQFTREYGRMFAAPTGRGAGAGRSA